MIDFEAPFKDKTILISAYDLIDLMVRHGISKPKAIVILSRFPT